MINGAVVNPLVDSGSIDNFVSSEQVQQLPVTILPRRETALMASSSSSAKMGDYFSDRIIKSMKT